jgi:hypothetical protein
LTFKEFFDIIIIVKRKEIKMLVKTHLITIGQSDEYGIRYTEKIANTKPVLNKRGLPTFILISNKGRMEVETLNMKFLEDTAKKFANPRGRGAVTRDKTRVYIKEKDCEKLMMIVEKTHIRKYAPMYDEV